MMLSALQKTTHFVLVLALASFFIFPVTTAAFFSNTETSTGQQFGAAVLLFEPLAATSTALTVTNSALTTTSIVIDTTAESIAAHYDVVVSDVAGDEGFCGSLELSATSTNGVSTTNLVGYQSGVMTQFGAWQLGFTDTSGDTSEGSVCRATLTITTWQDTLTKGAGYGDMMQMQIILTRGAGVVVPPTGSVALNEIFPAYSNQADEPLDREWAELFNGTNAVVDVAGWTLSEVSGTTEKSYTIVGVASDNGSEVAPYNSTNTQIAPGGFLVLEYVGNRLNNTGDTVRLYDASGVLVDDFAYPDTDNGDAQARVPDGVGAWIVQAPTPNATNNLSPAAFTFSTALSEPDISDEADVSPITDESLNPMFETSIVEPTSPSESDEAASEEEVVEESGENQTNAPSDAVVDDEVLPVESDVVIEEPEELVVRVVEPEESQHDEDVTSDPPPAKLEVEPVSDDTASSNEVIN